MKVGKKLQGEGKDVYFSVSNHKDFSFELGEYGLNDIKGDKPVICARDDRDMKYVMSGDFRFVFFFLSPDASSKGTIEMGVIRPSVCLVSR